MATTATSATALKLKRSDFGKQTYVNPKKLRVESDTYQRDQESAQVTRMVKNFNEKLFDPLVVARRIWTKNPDDFYWVLDGGHRLATALRLGLTEVPVRIVDVESKAEEAVLFTELNDKRRAVARYSKHRAMVVAGDATACAIEDALNDIGWKMVRERSENLREFKAVACVYDIWSRGESSEWAHPRHGEDRLSGRRLVQAVLQTIDMTWVKKDGAFNNNTLKGQAIFIEAFWDKIDRETFIDVMTAMAETTPNDLGVQAARKKAVANPYNARALVFTTVYNRTHNTKLRTSSLAAADEE